MDDDEFRGLQERVQLIQDMAGHPGWEVAVDRSKRTTFAIQTEILAGKLSLEDYQRKVAWIEGVQWFTTLPGRVQSELEVELQRRAEEA
jgi:hypothetical protein